MYTHYTCIYTIYTPSTHLYTPLNTSKHPPNTPQIHHYTRQVAVVSRNDTNNTLYHSVLGSAPGSWGVITQFTLEGVSDVTVPFTHAIIIKILWSKANFLAALKQTQWVSQDQENKMKRDMKVRSLLNCSLLNWLNGS